MSPVRAVNVPPPPPPAETPWFSFSEQLSGCICYCKSFSKSPVCFRLRFWSLVVSVNPFGSRSQNFVLFHSTGSFVLRFVYTAVTLIGNWWSFPLNLCRRDWNFAIFHAFATQFSHNSIAHHQVIWREDRTEREKKENYDRTPTWTVRSIYLFRFILHIYKCNRNWVDFKTDVMNPFPHSGHVTVVSQSAALDSVCFICLPFAPPLIIINSFSLPVLHALNKHLKLLDSCCQNAEMSPAARNHC